MARRKTTKEFIEQSKAIYGDKYIYDNTIYLGNDKPATLICKKHGEFTVMPHKHTGVRREECMYCKGYVPKIEAIDQNYLKEWFEYDPETGVIVNKATQQAMGSYDNGYERMGIQGERYMNHRIAYLYMTGEEPEIVDHINQDRSDNRWSNLRASNFSQNNHNNIAHINVYESINGFIGQSTIDYELVKVGPFETEDEAYTEIQKLKQEHINK